MLERLLGSLGSTEGYLGGGKSGEWAATVFSPDEPLVDVDKPQKPLQLFPGSGGGSVGDG